MQYIKFGSWNIPYRIQNNGTEKEFWIGKLHIPFSTYTVQEKKYYKIGKISVRLPFLDTYFITQSQMNYKNREQLTEDEIKKVAAKIFEEKVGYRPDFEHPRSMNEKIFWMKFYYHDPLITKCCDKFAVKDYVDRILGPGHTIPNLASWDCAEEIDFDSLPKQYALKVNWSSGYNVIVKDKDTINQEEIRRKVAQWMQPQKNSYYQTFNWGYKNMKPVVYAEIYMEQCEGQLYDYKFFCCNGKVKFWFIATQRYGNEKLTHDFYDMDFQHLDFDYGGRAHAKQNLQKPRFFEEMVQSAEKLAKPFPFVRVDFYETDNKFYVGEMTFYPGGGILPFTPVEWDYKLGEYIILPDKYREG